MIKINLATRKQAGAAPGQKGSGVSQAKASMDTLKGLPIRKVALPLIVGVFASYMLDTYKEEEIHKLENKLTKTRNEGARFESETQKFKNYEPLKKALDQDELTIRTKLDVIKRITSERSSPSKFLVSIANALPNDVWLADFKVEKNDVSFKGSAMGFGQISDFMKNLNENAFFSGVELKNTQQEKDGGIEIASFELKGKRR